MQPKQSVPPVKPNPSLSVIQSGLICRTFLADEVVVRFTFQISTQHACTCSMLRIFYSIIFFRLVVSNIWCLGCVAFAFASVVLSSALDIPRRPILVFEICFLEQLCCIFCIIAVDMLRARLRCGQVLIPQNILYASRKPGNRYMNKPYKVASNLIQAHTPIHWINVYE